MCFVLYLGFQRCAFLFEERTADPLVSTLWTCAYPGTECVCVCVCVCVEIDLALALKLCSFVVGLSYGLCIAQDIAYIFHAYDVQRSLRNIKKNAFQIHRKWSQNPPQGPGGPSLGALGAKRPQLPFQQAPQMDTQMTPKAPRGYPKMLLAPF